MSASTTVPDAPTQAAPEDFSEALQGYIGPAHIISLAMQCNTPPSLYFSTQHQQVSANKKVQIGAWPHFQLCAH